MKKSDLVNIAIISAVLALMDRPILVELLVAIVLSGTLLWFSKYNR